MIRYIGVKPAWVNRQERGLGANKKPRDALRRREPQRESNQWKKNGARHGRRERGKIFK